MSRKIYKTKKKNMTQTKDRVDVSYFLLRLTPDEKRRLSMIAKEKATTITSLIRYVLSHNLTIEDL